MGKLMAGGRNLKGASGPIPTPDQVLILHVDEVVDASSGWRCAFDPFCVLNHHRLSQRAVRHSELLAKVGAIWRSDIEPAVMHAIFTTDRADHSFDQNPLDWGFGLTEPMATKTLARFLTAGSGEVRAKRIRAFLQAVGLPECCADLDSLQRCRIVAEEDRIDLKLVWKNDAGRDVVVIIEAKFGHKITEGQLSGYRATVQRIHKCRPFASILLTLDDSVCSSLKGKQSALWRQVNWRDFWLRFERLRPVEHNLSLQMFLNTLWHRSGCLTQENRHGRV